ncbi:pyridoxamine 5'-phosphate oxidase family protein [Streptomyces sp. NPDC047046]|uniref:pyridoxamine 5'-phosphate oxidase family protein n=1 Tax=Streptomyces sp. NPDC047046 TaxID=3155378 RepID=UPI0033FF7ACC
MNGHQDTPGTPPAVETADALPQQGTKAGPKTCPSQPEAPEPTALETTAPGPTALEPTALEPAAPELARPEPTALEPVAPPPDAAPHTSVGAGRSAVPPICPVPDAEAATRLARERNVWLCTVRPDGTAHVTPVWFVHLHHRWWIGSDERAVKVRNVRRAHRVSLALEDGDHPLVAEGTARVLATPFPPEVVAAFREKYDWDVTELRPRAGARVLLEVRTLRWLLAGTAQ